MDGFITGNKTTDAKTVAGNLWKTRNKSVFHNKPKDLIDKLLLEKLPLARIARVAQKKGP